MDLNRELIGLLGWVISPVSRALPTQGYTNTEETPWIDIHVWSEIRPTIPLFEWKKASHLRPRGHCGN
jgi:hypothetical protein